MYKLEGQVESQSTKNAQQKQTIRELESKARSSQRQRNLDIKKKNNEIIGIKDNNEALQAQISGLQDLMEEKDKAFELHKKELGAQWNEQSGVIKHLKQELKQPTSAIQPEEEPLSDNSVEFDHDQFTTKEEQLQQQTDVKIKTMEELRL